LPATLTTGHTLAATLDQATSVSGVAAERIYVDRGYRGHNYTGAGEVMIAGRRRGLSATMRRELRPRSAIEATIGHMKTDGRLDRNFLLGHAGDAINALLAAAGQNLRLVLAALALSRLHVRRHLRGNADGDFRLMADQSPPHT
jgi:IS5 family transposase